MIENIVTVSNDCYFKILYFHLYTDVFNAYNCIMLYKILYCAFNLTGTDIYIGCISTGMCTG